MPQIQECLKMKMKTTKMRVLRFSEFLNESKNINEGRRNRPAYYEHPTPYEYAAKGDEMSTKELQIEAGKQGNAKYKLANFPRPDLLPDFKKIIEDFFNWDPFYLMEKYGPSAKLKFSMRGRSKDYPEEYAYFDGQNKVRLWFHGVLTSPIGKADIDFDIEVYNGGQAQIDYYSDSLMNDFDNLVESAKGQEFLKKAYLAIPDNKETDEALVMNKKGQNKWRWRDYWTDIPKTFQNEIFKDPIIYMYYKGMDEDGEQTAYYLKELFNDLNKRYYKEWQAIHRKGIKGAVRNLKAWFLSIKEHEEYMGTSLLESNEDEIPGGLADDLSIEDIAKRHSVSVGQIEEQLEKGKNVEMEHTDDPKKAEEIAKDHLMEMPDYYDKLEKIEPAHESVNEAKKFKKGDKVKYTGRKSVFNDLDPKEVYKITDIVDDGKGGSTIILGPAEHTPYTTYKGGDMVRPEDIKLA